MAWPGVLGNFVPCLFLLELWRWTLCMHEYIFGLWKGTRWKAFSKNWTECVHAPEKAHARGEMGVWRVPACSTEGVYSTLTTPNSLWCQETAALCRHSEVPPTQALTLASFIFLLLDHRLELRSYVADWLEKVILTLKPWKSANLMHPNVFLKWKKNLESTHPFVSLKNIIFLYFWEFYTFIL